VTPSLGRLSPRRLGGFDEIGEGGGDDPALGSSPVDSRKREPRLGTSPAVAIGLVGVMVALAALASAQSLWGVGIFQVAYGLLGLITLAATVLAVRRWGIVYRGWRPYPTYAEREAAKQEREIAEIKRAANRRDAMMRRAPS
jgi:hypothetical protein